MPIYDSTTGFAVQDPKAFKLGCQARDCPNHPEYKGLKMKACAKCKFVRYCSKECQSADWQKHKKICRDPQLVDISAWLYEYRPIFEWVCSEALLRDGVNRTGTHHLLVDVISAGRIGGAAPSPFYIMQPRTFPNTETAHLGGLKMGNSDLSMWAQEGDVGVAEVIFRFDMTYQRAERYGLPGPVSAEPAVHGWDELVRDVVNGTLTLEDVFKLYEDASAIAKRN
ncbi:zinc finger MYND domain-containing protein [Phanerochaete sordida]|uniref:Zinc finger MYND domain-containing protein n=1 Tax=Phanerochaete sordida TaxID=48140 RepID=A0A9P3GFQ6_9APHY|nr:zinc finger MYND domain-containing protein [Phanerochaete sordida]